MYQTERKPKSLRDMGKSTTLSLPNIAFPEMNVPQIQVSSEENAKFSTESKAFWDKTTQLLQDLSMLHEDVAEITCPCSKPNCPFRHCDTRTGLQINRCFSLQERQSLNGRVASRPNRYLTQSARHNVAAYLASMRPMHSTSAVALDTRYSYKPDCQVTEEPLAGHGQVTFVRNSPFRKAQRKHSAIRVSASYPATMNSLMVPSCLDFRSNSLPSRFESPVLHKGSSLDSLDSDKMHDIQKSFLRGQRTMSNVDLEQW